MKSVLSGVILNLFLSADCYAQLPQLESPFKVIANGKPIELTMGHAAPYVIDFNGDGLKDIIIGEFGESMTKEAKSKFSTLSKEEKKAFQASLPLPGRARVYLNTGTDKNPQFGDYTFLQAGGKDAAVKSSCCIGLDPNFVDLNGDGKIDFTSGEYFGGYIHFYKGTKDKPLTFEAAVDLAQPDTILKSKTSLINCMRTANFVDFDKDGDFDMIWGNVHGDVFYSKNTGSKKQYEFANSIPLTTEGKAISVDSKSDPLPVDWDNDGILDLLVGTEASDIVFFKGKQMGNTDFEPGISLWMGNIYKPGEKPKYKLVKESMDALGDKRPYPGYRLRLAVADWNNDKKLDLLVGNCYEADPVTSGNVYVFLRKKN